MQTISLAQKFSGIHEYWSPKIAGEINDSYVKLVKFRGEFMWHHHDNEDEMFLIVKGTMRMKIRDGRGEREERVGPGEFIIIPRGVEHMPIADEEVHCVLLEPKSTLNTGNVRNERTLEQLERV
jgi:mannose-6-phosphate isomerase-like protein (cupin superfamily)